MPYASIVVTLVITSLIPPPTSVVSDLPPMASPGLYGKMKNELSHITDDACVNCHATD